jgi:phage terminase large subunit-like protein
MNTLPDISQTGLVELAKRRAAELVAKRQEMSSTNSGPEWIMKNFYIPELKGPITFEPYQKAVLREALTPDHHGNFPYSTIVWSDIKKSGKSCIAAAVGLWRAFSVDWGSVIVIANDLKGADTRVGMYMRRAIELNPTLKILCKIRNYRIETHNRSFVESVAIDPTGEAGSNADMVIFSELWGAHQKEQQRMWAEMTLPPNKFGKSFRWVETYAGYTGESPLLENLYDTGVKNGELLDVGIPGLELYSNRAARLLILWNTRPRNPWQTDDYYAQEAAMLAPNEFLRLHRNQWVSSLDTFVPPEWWHACHRPLPELQSRQPMVFALDAAVSNDTFGIVGISRHGNDIAVRYARRWLPPKGGKIDYEGPKQEILRLSKEYNIVEWAYDDFQLHDLATTMIHDGVGWFRKFPQGAPRAIADKTLFDLIRDRRIYHSGEPDLEEHILNCNAVQEGETKMRLIKKSESRKIDLAVCLSMAASEALRLNMG